MQKLFIIFLIFSCINTLFTQEEPKFALAGFASETIAGSETTPNAIAEINLSNTRIFPNPIDNSGTIQFKLKEKQQINFEIYDAIGNLVTKLDSDVYNAGYNQIEFNTQEFNKGLYFIKITNVQSCFCMEFIKNQVR